MELQNPLDNTPQVKYAFTEDFQRLILGLILCDRYFLVQSMDLIKPTYFNNEVHELVSRVVFNYFRENKNPPSKVMVKEILRENLGKKFPDQTQFEKAYSICLTELSTVYDFFSRGGVGEMYPDIDSSEAILKKVVSFAKAQSLKECWKRSADLVKKAPNDDDTYLKVDALYQEARKVDRKLDLGLDYFQTVQERYNRVQEEDEKYEGFTIGFEQIDECLNGKGLKRGELGAWMGASGRGKSLVLVVAAVKNIAKGHKVLYISTEMDQDRIASRFDAMFTRIGHNELIPKREDVFASLTKRVADYEDKQRLIIKQFASGSTDMAGVRAYHSQLKMMGFVPDLVIVDYPGDMKSPSDIPTHEARSNFLRDLRGLGVEERHCTLVAIQPNKFANELTLEEFLDESQQSESYAQFKTLDAFWTLNQTDVEKSACVGRVFVAKSRNGKSRVHFKIKYDYDKQTLWVESCSHEHYKNRMSKIKEKIASNVEIDVVEKIIKPWSPTDGEEVR